MERSDRRMPAARVTRSFRDVMCDRPKTFDRVLFAALRRMAAYGR